MTDEERKALVERLRSKVVLKQYPPTTLIIDGEETTFDGGQVVKMRNPDGDEAADLIEADGKRIAELMAVKQ